MGIIVATGILPHQPISTVILISNGHGGITCTIATVIFIYMVSSFFTEQSAQCVCDCVRTVARKNWKIRGEGFDFIFLAGFSSER
jgi:hypothetical protein